MAMGPILGSGRRARRSPMAEINVTPMVDVMLVLLIIFMVTAPLLVAGVPVDLPDSKAGALDQEQQAGRRSRSTRDGAIFVDEQPVAAGALGAAPRRRSPRPRASKAARASSCAPTAASITAG